MGSGKSTVGQSLAQNTGLQHIDLDFFIEEQENLSVPQIIEKKGIIYFRKAEKKHLETLLQRPEAMILSLGGGTPCYYNNMELIKHTSDVYSIYLRANVPFLTNRLFSIKEGRPLIASITNKEELAEFIGKHLLERSAFYDMANHTIDIQEKTVAQIAQEITNLG